MKNKFFLCFRPPFLIEPDHSHVLHTDCGASTTIVIAKDKKKSDSSTIKSTLLDENKMCRFPGENMAKKTFSSVFGMLSLKASLRNRTCDKNIHRLNSQSKTVKRLKDFGSDKSEKPKRIDANIQQISLDASILSASSSSNSSYESKNVVPLSMKKLSSQLLPMPTDETYHMAANMIAMLFAFALFLTMFWGKMIAMLFALIWLYAFPLRRWKTGEYDAVTGERRIQKSTTSKGQCINVLT